MRLPPPARAGRPSDEPPELVSERKLEAEEEASCPDAQETWQRGFRQILEAGRRRLLWRSRPRSIPRLEAWREAA